MTAKRPAKNSLNAQVLEALGAPRLAELLLMLSEGNTAVKVMLRLALAHEKGPLEMGREVALDLNRYKLRRYKPEALKHLSLKAYKDLLLRIVGSTETFWKMMR